MTTTIEAEHVQDLQRIRAFLSQDPFATAYMLGNLDAIYGGYCTWYLASEGGRDTAVLQVYTGLSAPVLITHGTSSGLTAILARFLPDLPTRAHIHLMPEHLGVLDRHFELGSLRPMVRMALVATQLSRSGSPARSDAPGDGYGAVERLGHRDTGDIMELFTFYPDTFFEPHQLSTGHYYGVRQDSEKRPGHLVAVAGIHVASRFERIAALGNIVTHPDHRGRGLSTRVTAHLCEVLTAEGIELLALNVERKNASALKVYEKLGFREHCTYLEGFVTRPLGKVLDNASEGVANDPSQGAS